MLNSLFSIWYTPGTVHLKRWTGYPEHKTLSDIFCAGEQAVQSSHLVILSVSGLQWSNGTQSEQGFLHLLYLIALYVKGQLLSKDNNIL